MTPPRPVLRAYWALHKAVSSLSGGRLGTRRPGGGRPGVLFLWTRGRRSGEPRRNGLYYIEDGTSFVVAASNAGDASDPGWWKNLVARLDAEVEIGRLRAPVRARQAVTEEAARLWPRLDDVYPDFAAYRARAGREIPVVILEPRAPT
jgi:deazaflavin-dependent oxidoreductase (nitroreductase family)